MKRMIAVLTVVVLILSLTACSENQFCNLISFTEKFNKASDVYKIEYEDYITDGEGKYNLFFSKESEDVLLSIKESKPDRVEQVRVLVGKYDAQGKEKQITSDEYKVFLSVAESMVMAYTGYDKEKTVSLMKELSLYSYETIKKQGELTKTLDDFHFVFYSNSLVSMFTVTNTWLLPVPETKKPQSVPYFGATTNTDGESIKLR